MVDVLTPELRRLNMSRIRGRDTKPEMIIRRGLHALGLRFRLHDPKLPGRPDLIFRRYGVVIFVHGCFWHGHQCAMFKEPVDRRDFWLAKIYGNRERDARVKSQLLTMGWRVAEIWECSLRGRKKLDRNQLLEQIKDFITASDVTQVEISGSKLFST